MTVWPSGLRRWLKAPFRKGVGSNPTAVNAAISCFFPQASLPAQGLHRAPLYKCGRTVRDSVSEFRGQGARFDAQGGGQSGRRLNHNPNFKVAPTSFL